MQGNVLEQTGGGGDKINGIVEEYVVASGGNVNAGEFVKLDSNQVKQLESSTDEIHGIAKTKGTDGQTVKIIVPEEVA